MDPSTRSTAAATAVVVLLVGLAIAVLVTLGGGVDPPAPTAGTTSTTTPATVVPTSAEPAPSGPAGTPKPTRTPKPQQPELPQGTGEVCVPQVDEQTLTVMTFNIKSGRVTGRVDMGRVGDQIAAYGPDIVLMQEVDKGRAWSNRLDEAAVLGQRLGMEWAFGGNDIRSPTNMLGNAILSRYPIRTSNNVQLPALPGKHRRGLLGALVDVDGIEVEVYSTHLEHTSSADRERQVAAIAGVLGPRPAPRFLGGDFNAGPTSAVMARARTLATDTWAVVGSGAGFTAPSGRPRVRIDYLMHDGSDTVEVTPLLMRVLPTNASDHRAVMASYRLREDEGEICVPALSD
ncbi:MAG: hypothetical protein JWN84_2168 [Nocardioides sp.]|nr:hypothetical protein [Nocardioides sp.]